MAAFHLFLFFSLFFFCFFFCVQTSYPNSTSFSCPNSTSHTPNIASSKDDAQLKVLVPNIASASYPQLVNCSDPLNVSGFCIDVFEAALSMLPGSLSSTAISYTCFNFSVVPGGHTLNYDDMVDTVANGSYDVVVGDVTITAQRASKVDFTQQYLDSGVVVITKLSSGSTSEALFFWQPFDKTMWIIFGAVFFVIAVLLCIAEFNEHPELEAGSFRIRAIKIFWLVTLDTMLSLSKESIRSKPGQVIGFSWVVFMGLVAANYTAGLSSFLTANSFSPPSVDILTLRDSNQTIAIRQGANTQNLLETQYHFSNLTQLRSIRNNSQFIGNITEGPSKGGVIAIVDELPLPYLLLAKLSCEYGIAGPQLNSEGLGFGFRKGLIQPWVKQFSIAILNLTEKGCIQNMQSKYSLNVASKCSSDGPNTRQISGGNILPLFITLIVVDAISVVIVCLSTWWSTITSGGNMLLLFITSTIVDVMFIVFGCLSCWWSTITFWCSGGVGLPEEIAISSSRSMEVEMSHS